jgi:hypothetical protein
MIYLIFALVSVSLFGSIALAVYFLRKRNQQAAEAARANTAYRDANLPRATHVVWVELWGLDLDWTPRIDWVDGARLNCYEGRGWKAQGMCVAGLSWRDTMTCAVAWPAGTTRFSDTAFAHELLHARSWHTGEVSDHSSPAFMADVLAADAALRAAGL